MFYPASFLCYRHASSLFPLLFCILREDNKEGNSSIHPFYLKEVHGDADFSDATAIRRGLCDI